MTESNSKVMAKAMQSKRKYIRKAPNPFTKEDFIKKANKTHSSYYDYSRVIYVNAKTLVEIICPAHGIFKQSPDNHSRGKGCVNCSIEKSSIRNRGSLAQFLKKAKAVHGSFYDYSLVEYINSGTNVKIICPEHGVFEQAPDNHYAGKGCYQCSLLKHGYSRDKFQNRANAKLYIIECFNDSETFYKVGITSQKIKYRFSKGKDMPYQYKVLYMMSGDGGYIWDLEKKVQAILKLHRYQPKIPFRGQTECFLKIPNKIMRFLGKLNASDQLPLIA